MGLRDKEVKEENRYSFLVSDSPGYEDPQDIARFQVHRSRPPYVITEHEFGSFAETHLIGLRLRKDTARRVAYRAAMKLARDLGTGDIEDKTSFNYKRAL